MHVFGASCLTTPRVKKILHNVSRYEIRAPHWFTSAHVAQSTCSKKNLSVGLAASPPRRRHPCASFRLPWPPCTSGLRSTNWRCIKKTEGQLFRLIIVFFLADKEGNNSRIAELWPHWVWASRSPDGATVTPPSLSLFLYANFGGSLAASLPLSSSLASDLPIGDDKINWSIHS